MTSSSYYSPPPFHPLPLSLPLLVVVVAVVLSSISSSSSLYVPRRLSAMARPRPMPRCGGGGGDGRTIASSSVTTTTTTMRNAPLLSSAYDPDLPPSLVGEAVRSALRSDRGICVDFVVDRYRRATDRHRDDDDGGGPTTRRRSVNVVGMRGKGTGAFLNSKFAGSVPRIVDDDDDDGGSGGGDGGERRSTSSSFVRRGRTFETAYLTSKGRIIDRLLVLYFGNGKDDGDSNTNITMEDAFLITSPGNYDDEAYDNLSRTIFPLDGVSLTKYDRDDRRSKAGGGRHAMATTATRNDDVVGVITLACSTLRDARSSFVNNMLDATLLDGGGGTFAFPDDGTCDHYRVSSKSSSSTAGGGGGGRGGGDMSYHTDVYAFRHTFLSSDICHGYTLLFIEGGEGGSIGGASVYEDVWRRLTDEYNDVGPVGIGYREYETLRIEAGLPGYGNEMTGDGPTRRGGDVAADDANIDNDDDDDEDAATSNYCAKSNPLELHLRDIVDVNKGCYQGQEGVASVLKNKRGPPRQLYQAVFYDSENDFHGGGIDDDDASFGLLSTDNEMLTEFRKLKGRRRGRDAGGTAALANDTRQPRPGDDIYVLGSNDSILVGKITSVAEPNGTGDAKTIALALAKRPGPILSAIRERGLELPRWWEDVEDDDDRNDGDDDADDRRGVARGGVIANEKDGSGIMRPPPLDSLHNLEIVIGGTYTVGRLVSVPSRRYGGATSGRGGRDVAPLLDYETMGEVVTGGDAEGPGYFRYDVQDDDGIREVAAASQSTNGSVPRTAAIEGDLGEMDELLAEAKEDFAKAAAQAEAAAIEAKRKEDKMKMLQARAEAAMAARRKKSDG